MAFDGGGNEWQLMPGVLGMDVVVLRCGTIVVVVPYHREQPHVGVVAGGHVHHVGG